MKRSNFVIVMFMTFFFTESFSQNLGNQYQDQQNQGNQQRTEVIKRLKTHDSVVLCEQDLLGLDIDGGKIINVDFYFWKGGTVENPIITRLDNIRRKINPIENIIYWSYESNVLGKSVKFEREFNAKTNILFSKDSLTNAVQKITCQNYMSQIRSIK